MTGTARCVLGTLLAALVTAGCESGRAAIGTVEQAVACAERALGGRESVRAVTRLALTLVSAPVAPSERAPALQLETTAEVLVAWPDGFRYSSQAVAPGGSVLHTIRGIAGDRAFLAAVDDQGVVREIEHDADFEAAIRREMAQWAFLLLLRDTAFVPLEMALDRVDASKVTLAASSGGDRVFEAGLDRQTCQLTDVSWHREPNFGDTMAGRTSQQGRLLEKREFFDHAAFDGLRLPSRMLWSTDGAARSEWRVQAIDVNPSLPGDLLPPGLVESPAQGRP